MSQHITDAYHQLKNAILNGEWKPGERLGEEQLSKQLRISRNTLRLVLAHLENDGLVDAEPFKGRRVAKLSLDKARQVLEARQLLEGATAKLVVIHVTDGDIDALAGILAQMKVAGSTDDYDQYSLLNGQFHHTIYNAAQNAVISQILLELKTRLVRVQYRTALVPGRTSQSLREHTAIFEALRNRDADAADQAMQQHVRHVWETIRDHHRLLDIGGGGHEQQAE